MSQPHRENPQGGHDPTSHDGDDVPGGDATGVPVGSLSYAQASAELDDIVDFFESGDVDVDQLVGRLARATAVIEELDKRLRGVRAQVEELVPRLTTVLAGVDREDTPVELDQSEVRSFPEDGALF